MIPKHFSLVKEHPASYEIHDSRDGKRFHIAKNGLDLDMHGKLSEIQRFEEGGEAEEDAPENKPSKQKKEDPSGIGDLGIDTHTDPGKRRNVAASLGKAFGHFDDGGTVGPTGFPVIKVDAGQFDKDAKKVAGKSSGGEIQHFDGGGQAIPYDKLIPQEQAANAPFGTGPNALAENDIEAAPPAQQLPADSANAAPATAPLSEAAPVQQDTSTQPGAPPSAAAPAETPTPSDPLIARPVGANAALAAEQASIEAGAQAETEAGQKTAAAYGKLSSNLDKLLTPQQIMAQHQAADDALMKKYQAKEINPDHYWESRDTGQKVLAGISMILGGFGARANGGKNAAMETINSAIQRDMESQRANQNGAMNLWKMNREATQNDIQANLATRNQMLTAVQAQALQYAAAASGPEAKMRVAPLISQLAQQKNMNNFQRSMLSAAGSGQILNVDPALMLQNVPEKDRPQAAKEIANAQEIKKLKDAFQQSFQTLQHSFLAGKGTNDRESAVQAFAGRIAKLSEGRFNLQEANTQADALLPQMTDFKKTITNKQQRVDQFFDSMVTAPVFRGATGIDLNRFASTNLTPGPAAPQTQTMGGREYVKVQGGWVPADSATARR